LSNKENKTILITGGTGYLGRNIIQSLVSKNYNIVALVRDTSNVRQLSLIIDSGNIFSYSRLNFTKIVSNVFNQVDCDVIIHCATNYGRDNESIESIFETNVLQPLSLIELASKNRVKSFINTDTTLHFNINAYSLSKHQFKEYAKHILNNSKIQFINIRLEAFFGPYNSNINFVTNIIRNCMSNKASIALTKGEQLRDFIYIEDVVNGFILIIQNLFQINEDYIDIDIGSGEVISIKELVKYIKKITKSKTELKFSAIPYRNNETMYSCASLSKISSFGWSKKISLEDGLRKTIFAETSQKD
jgi:CDP-paratose synthetase